MLDLDLAQLYGVLTGALNQAVTRNKRRFPADFMFRLTAEEFRNLLSQSVIARPAHGGSRISPLAFTEHGVAMLASVLRSDRATQKVLAPAGVEPAPISPLRVGETLC